MNFFAGKDYAADSSSNQATGGSMAQTPAEAQTAAQNAMRVGANYAAAGSGVQAGSSSASGSSGSASSYSSGPAASASSNSSTVASGPAVSAGSAAAGSTVHSSQQPQSSSSDFGWDRSQFDSRAGFGSPADSVNLNHQSSPTAESASAAETAAKEEAVAAENQRKAEEILKRNKK